MSKLKVTDLEHIPEGPPRDLMMYLEDNAEAIQRLDQSEFWAIILCYISVYYDATSDGPLDMAIKQLVLLIVPIIEDAKKTLMEVDND